LCDHGEGESGFTGGFRAEHLDDPAAGKSADAEGTVNQEIPGGNDIDIDNLVIAEAHDGGFAEFFLDVGDGEVQVALAGLLEFFVCGFFCGCFCGHSGVVGGGVLRKLLSDPPTHRKKKDVRSNKKLPSP
jgi:hypothetical protein